MAPRLTPESFTYQSSGLRVQGFALAPGPRRPIAVYLRGGNNHPRHGHSMNLDAADMADPELSDLARAGYCVLAPNYRGAELSEGADDVGLRDLDDVVHLPLARFGDATDVTLFGWSMGGQKALMLLMTRRFAWKRHVRAVVLGAPATDLFAQKRFRPLLYESWRADYGLSDADLRARSPAANLDRVRALSRFPILILHGTGDDRVSVTESLDFTRALVSAGVTGVRLVTYPGDDHGLRANKAEAVREILAFMAAARARAARAAA